MCLSVSPCIDVFVSDQLSVCLLWFYFGLTFVFLFVCCTHTDMLAYRPVQCVITLTHLNRLLRPAEVTLASSADFTEDRMPVGNDNDDDDVIIPKHSEQAKQILAAEKAKQQELAR